LGFLPFGEEREGAMAEDRFSFRWGIPWLDSGCTTIPNFMIRHYIEAGVTRAEFLVILHLAAHHCETAEGQAGPSLATVAAEMGYRDSESVRYHIRNLEAKDMLTRTLRAGETSVYDLSGFSRKALAASIEHGTDILQRDVDTLPTSVAASLQRDLDQSTRRRPEELSDGAVRALTHVLVSLGVPLGEARRLTASRPAELISDWIAHARGREIDDVPAFLVSKLRAGEEPPTR
jgi:hypothetical protein